MSPSLLVEKFLPFSSGAATAFLCILFQDEISRFFMAHALEVSGLYAAIFGWSAIQTGFLFGVFGFVVGAKDGFVAEVQDTTPMRRFLAYTRNATIIGFVLTFSSMPLMVANFTVQSAGPTVYVVLALWFSLFVWAFLAFARVAYLFGLLMKPKAKPFIPG